MKNIINVIVLIHLVFLSTLFANPTDFPNAPAQGPINGLILVLLGIGGGILGYKKLKK